MFAFEDTVSTDKYIECTLLFPASDKLLKKKIKKAKYEGGKSKMSKQVFHFIISIEIYDKKV